VEWRESITAKRKKSGILTNRSSSTCLIVLDAVSLYASAMSKFEYPSGIRFWADGKDGRSTIENVRDALNSIDEKFYLGIVDCEVFVPFNNICPLLAVHSPSGRLVYPTGSFRTTKTTIDLMQAVKYNKAVIKEVFKAELWTERCFIFKKGTDELFLKRLQAKYEKNTTLDKAIKLLLCEGYGKTGQKPIENNLFLVETK